MREENTLENATERGIQLMTGLRKLQEEYSQIGDVRGKGLMIGTEFIVDGKPDKAKPLAKEIIHAAEDRTCYCYPAEHMTIPCAGSHRECDG